MQPANNPVDAKVEAAKRERADFERRVRVQEALANRNPVAYRRRVVAWALLGYGFIFTLLLTCILLLIFIIWALMNTQSGGGAAIKIVLVLVLVIFAILRSLWVKFDKVPGLQIKREEAPALFAEVERIVKNLKAPKIDEIRIDQNFNAAAVQRPRLGVLGFYKSTLLLGMPLLVSLTPDEARSVIAHEFGHFSGKHGRLGSWIYRINQTWRALGQNLRGNYGAMLVYPFYNWYMPRFSAVSFAMRRANEYEADAAAALAAGPHAAASALLRLQYMSGQVNETFWEPYFKQSIVSATPPANYFGKLPDAGRAVPDAETVENSIVNALKEQTDFDDSHPCLTDRLTALKSLPEDLDSWVKELTTPIEESAADAYFGARLPHMLAKLEAFNVEKIASKWKVNHERSRQKVQELNRLRIAMTQMPPTAKDLARLAELTYAIEDKEAAEPLYIQALELDPSNPQANLGYGALLLEAKDDAGIVYVEKAISLDPSLTNTGLQVMASYHYQRGEHDVIAELKDRAFGHAVQKRSESQMDRQITISNHFAAATAPEDEKAALTIQLATLDRLDRAYFVDMQVVGNSGRTCKYLVLIMKRKVFESEGDQAKLVQQAQKLDLPADCYLYAPINLKSWRKRMDSVAGALIYSAS